MNLTDQTRVADTRWWLRKEEAMRDNYYYKPWFRMLKRHDITLMERLIKKQNDQGDMEPLMGDPDYKDPVGMKFNYTEDGLR